MNFLRFSANVSKKLRTARAGKAVFYSDTPILSFYGPS